MGTSASSRGPGGGVPLVPEWVPPATDQPAPSQPPPPQMAPARRFQTARTNLGGFARTGAGESLRRGLGHYSRSGLGGAAAAASRMGGTARTAGGLYGPKEMPDSEVRGVLKNSSDSAVRQKVWEASKVVGKAVEADLKELVGLRNDAAKKAGFPNFHALQLALSEQTGPELIKLFVNTVANLLSI